MSNHNRFNLNNLDMNASDWSYL